MNKPTTVKYDFCAGIDDNWRLLECRVAEDGSYEETRVVGYWVIPCTAEQAYQYVKAKNQQEGLQP